MAVTSRKRTSLPAQLSKRALQSIKRDCERGWHERCASRGVRYNPDCPELARMDAAADAMNKAKSKVRRDRIFYAYMLNSPRKSYEQVLSPAELVERELSSTNSVDRLLDVVAPVLCEHFGHSAVRKVAKKRAAAMRKQAAALQEQVRLLEAI